MKTVTRQAVSTVLALCLLAAAAPAASAQGELATPAQLNAAREYVKKSWRTLARSNRGLAAAAVDPKFKPSPTGRWPVYVSRKESLAAVERALRSEMPAADFARIELRQLPENVSDIKEHGLLYLPHPYVVPGGRFNEMYGWDSYFIQVGLLRDGELELARGMVENFLYQIEHYGKILNANRTYYLSRSQPPFLTRMLLGVYERRRDREWLARAWPAVESYYRFWTEGGHLTPQTGLSRYFDAGEGPAPEVVSDERDAQGRTHYERVREFYRTERFDDYDVRRFYDRERDELTPLFYKGDRSMRESGFDPSNRFGPFSAAITSYNPVCLNSLLYVMERDAATILRELGRGREARAWDERARLRAERVSQSFLSLVLKGFVEHNVIVEKYDVVDRDSQVSAGLRFGYASNEIGFGWTNAAFVELYAQLPVGQRHRVRELKGPRQF